jgi:hypothetical protein
MYGCVFTSDAIRSATTEELFSLKLLDEPENELQDRHLRIGTQTRARLIELSSEGSITPTMKKDFYGLVSIWFYATCKKYCSYIQITWFITATSENFST